MRILGITDGQASGAAIIEDGRILAAINEERIARIKLARGFPWQSIQEVLTLTNTKPHEIERGRRRADRHGVPRAGHRLARMVRGTQERRKPAQQVFSHRFSLRRRRSEDAGPQLGVLRRCARPCIAGAATASAKSWRSSSVFMPLCSSSIITTRTPRPRTSRATSTMRWS